MAVVLHKLYHYLLFRTNRYDNIVEAILLYKFYHIIRKVDSPYRISRSLKAYLHFKQITAYIYAELAAHCFGEAFGNE